MESDNPNILLSFQSQVNKHEDMIRAILENLQLGKLDDCMKQYRVLQESLLDISKDLDNYPPANENLHSDIDRCEDKILESEIFDDLRPVWERKDRLLCTPPACDDCFRANRTDEECRVIYSHTAPGHHLSSTDRRELGFVMNVIASRHRQETSSVQAKPKRSYKLWDPSEIHNLVLGLRCCGRDYGRLKAVVNDRNEITETVESILNPDKPLPEPPENFEPTEALIQLMKERKMQSLLKAQIKKAKAIKAKSSQSLLIQYNPPTTAIIPPTQRNDMSEDELSETGNTSRVTKPSSDKKSASTVINSNQKILLPAVKTIGTSMNYAVNPQPFNLDPINVQKSIESNSTTASMPPSWPSTYGFNTLAQSPVINGPLPMTSTANPSTQMIPPSSVYPPGYMYVYSFPYPPQYGMSYPGMNLAYGPGQYLLPPGTQLHYPMGIPPSIPPQQPTANHATHTSTSGNSNIQSAAHPDNNSDPSQSKRKKYKKNREGPYCLRPPPHHSPKAVITPIYSFVNLSSDGLSLPSAQSHSVEAQAISTASRLDNVHGKTIHRSEASMTVDPISTHRSSASTDSCILATDRAYTSSSMNNQTIAARQDEKSLTKQSTIKSKKRKILNESTTRDDDEDLKLSNRSTIEPSIDTNRGEILPESSMGYDDTNVGDSVLYIQMKDSDHYMVYEPNMDSTLIPGLLNESSFMSS